MNDVSLKPPMSAGSDPTRPPASEAGQARRVGARRRRLRRWLILAVLLAGAAGAAGWWYTRPGPAAVAAPATVEVARGDIADLVSALGTLQPVRYVDVGAQISGQLQRLHARIGDQVQRGQLLVEVDSRVLQSRVQTDRAELDRLRGVLAQQQAQRALAEAQARRQQTMFATNATSRDALDTAMASVRVLDAQITQTQAQLVGQQSVLNADETSLSYTRIVAPMNGTVISVTAVEGQTLNANQTAPILLRIADLTTMTVATQVSEADQPRLSVGMPVWFHTLGRPERRYESQLRQIYPTPEVVNNVVLYSALFDVANEDGALLPQMSAQVFFVRASAQNVLIVPVGTLSAARGPGNRRTVQVLSDSGIATRTVEIGASDRINVEIRSGLAEGDRVVIGTGEAARPPGRPAARTPRL